MSARYLIRFDDLCPTMNARVWREIEAALVEAHVTPILAVVPANADPALCVDPPDPGFWDHVRRWQARGWTVGLHGHTHRYVTGDGGIMGINPRSEVAGLPRAVQVEKLSKGIRVFEAEGVRPDVWVAPGHSFDGVTLEALREVGLPCVSDGFAAYPFRDEDGIFWVPQQLWRFRAMPFGVWTVCVHHNRFGPREVARLRAELGRHADRMTSLPEVERLYGDRPRGWGDQLFSGAFRVAFEVKHGRRRLGARRPATSWEA
jgi:predicted deacetylase